MAGSTTNLGLTKPTYSEDADIAVINTNMDTLDSKIGAVGSTSLQAQIASANEAIATESLGNLNSLSALQTALVTLNGTISNNQFKNITFGMNNADGLFASTVYSGTLIRFSSTRFRVEVGMGQHAYGNIVGSYNNGTWEWDSLALNSVIVGQSVSGVDANNLITTGRYLLNGNIANLPYGNYGYLDVIASGSNVVQYYSNLNAVSLYVRNKYSGTWSDWQELALNSKIMPNETYTGDLNNASEGVVYTGSGVTNTPVNYAYWFVITMLQKGNAQVGSQIAIARTGDNPPMYYRVKSGGTWTAWQELALKSNMENYSVQSGSANWGTEVTITRKANARMRITGARSGLGFEIVVPKDTNEYVILSNVNSALSSVTVAMSSVKFTSKSSGYGSTIDWISETWS